MSEIGIIYKIIGIVIASALMIILGRADKKQKLSTRNKLIFQILISLIVIYFGVKIEFLRDPSLPDGYLYLNYLTIPLTTIWLVSITNSIGQVDELGDITLYIVFIASLTFLAVSFIQRQGLILAEVLSLILAAVSFIFIRYLPRRKFSSYYMSFGFILAIIAIVGVLKSAAALTLLIPLLILGVPLIDSSYSIVAAYAQTEGQGQGDYPSFSESRLRQKLQSYGFSPRGANLTIIGSSLYLSLSALIISVNQSLYLLVILVIFGGLVFEWLKKQVQSGEIIIGEGASYNRVRLFQVDIDQLDNQKTIQKIEEFIVSKRPHLVVTPDTLAILRTRVDLEYHAILKSADLVTPDGAGIVWATATLNRPLAERVTGIDIINSVCQLATKKGYSLYLLGSFPGVAKEASLNLAKRYPGLKVVGNHHGYFVPKFRTDNPNNKNKEEAEIIREIKEKKPDVLLVGMGMPKQEKWIAKNLNRLNVPVCMGVGGSFDVLSGKIPRAPLWMQRHGMEWVYRLIKQPKRVLRVLALFYFMWLVIAGKIIFTLKEID